MLERAKVNSDTDNTYLHSKQICTFLVEEGKVMAYRLRPKWDKISKLVDKIITINLYLE